MDGRRPRVLKANRRTVKEAARTVRSGGLIIYPTDTVYGLGCDPFNVRAVRRVFEVKGREAKRPLPVLASSLEEILRIAVLDEEALRLARSFWPGPLTLVVPRKPVLPDVVTCGLPSVGVRVPRHEFALEVIRACGGLLVGTSANRSGRPAPRTAQEAISELGDRVDLVIDAGPAPLGMPSTVLDLTGPEPKVIRVGGLPLERLRLFFKA
ncbi:threonylcarbamoyl-AMP synthase [Candidatus Bathyarchaeota archaeon ex4484_135]|nr:MAG: threonylcarbamoyl-AMP synthase [Candidatus Bathyarchaeota archaeon ex4484_135]